MKSHNRKYLGFVAVSVFLLSCAEIERDNPYEIPSPEDTSKEDSSSSAEAASEPSSSYSIEEPSSSSSLPPETVLCEFSGICSPVSSEVCDLLGGTTVQSCPESSSSGLIALSSSSVPSSSSAPPSSSSVPPSSSSTAPSSSSDQPSSSSTPPSSSSLVPSSSSLEDLLYEGKTYRTVVIGTQTWMAENLNYAVEGSKCYSNNPSNCTAYGSLYNWATAMALPSSCNSNSCSSQIQPKHRGICPSGWHIPNSEDWGKLSRYIDGTTGTFAGYASPTAGKYLRAKSGWNEYQGKSNSTDQFEFSALPGGVGRSDGSFDHIGNVGNWWSASEYGNSSNNAHYWNIDYRYESVQWNYYVKSYLSSVRCLQD